MKKISKPLFIVSLLFLVWGCKENTENPEQIETFGKCQVLQSCSSDIKPVQSGVPIDVRAGQEVQVDQESNQPVDSSQIEQVEATLSTSESSTVKGTTSELVDDHISVVGDLFGTTTNNVEIVSTTGSPQPQQQPPSISVVVQQPPQQQPPSISIVVSPTVTVTNPQNDVANLAIQTLGGVAEAGIQVVSEAQRRAQEEARREEEARRAREARNQERINADRVDSNGVYPIVKSITDNDINRFNHLVELGVNLDVKAPNGDSLLIHATRYNRSNMVQVLLGHNANIMATDTNRATALHIASGNGFDTIVNLLLAKSRDYGFLEAKDTSNNTAMVWATHNNKPEIVKKLAQAGADVNTWSGSDNGTPIHHASSVGNLAVVDALINYHADVNRKNGSGKFPLILATYYNRVEVIRRLVSVPGINLNARTNSNDADGETALHSSSHSGFLDIMKILIENGADRNAKTERQTEVPITKAIKNNQGQALRYLLDVGADKNITVDYHRNDNTSYTDVRPIYIALRENRRDMAIILAEHGASFECRISHSGLRHDEVWKINGGGFYRTNEQGGDYHTDYYHQGEYNSMRSGCGRQHGWR